MTNKKVLYFDDERFISNALAENLELFGWNVTLVSTAEELFGELSDQYDILIIDIMAPVPDQKNESIEFTKGDIQQMDQGCNTGIVFATKIWEINNQEFADLPILFLSARKPPESIITFMNEGRKCDCLCKPQLTQAIDENLKRLLNN